MPEIVQTKIFVIDHSESDVEFERPYQLLHVGKNKALEPNDSTGINISYKNFAYSEITGLYWIWKNALTPITGLMHYRRFLANSEKTGPISQEEILSKLECVDCLVAEKINTICAVKDHYCYHHLTEDYRILCNIFESQPPQYQHAFNEVMNGTELIPYNIMITTDVVLDSYCEWLFSILDQCEESIELYIGKDKYQQRVFGFIAERLMNIWLIANDIKVAHIPLWNPPQIDLSPSSKTDERAFLNRSIGKDGITLQTSFDAELYLRLHEDVRNRYSENPSQSIEHYIEDGYKSNRYISLAYDVDDYINVRPKQRVFFKEQRNKYFIELRKEAKKKPLILSRNKILGITKRRFIDYAPVYDWLYYTTKYDDVPNDFYDTEKALDHFLSIGMAEGRSGSKGFNLERFKQANPELVRKYGQDNRRYYLNYILRDSKSVKGIDWRYVDD